MSKMTRGFFRYSLLLVVSAFVVGCQKDFSEEDISIIRVAMQEIEGASDRKLLISQITDTIISKMEEFFKLQLEKGRIRNVNSKAISLMCFSIIFQSLILWQIYGDTTDIESDYFADDYLDILFNGIKL